MTFPPALTLVGRLVAEPDLRFTANGKPFVRLVLATSSRKKDTDGNWQDTEPTFWRGSLFGPAAETIDASELAKGTQLLVVADHEQRSYTDKAGAAITSLELTFRHVAVLIDRDPVRLQRTERRPATQQPQPDPWQVSDEPPF